MAYSSILYDVADSVASVVMNRPDVRNGLNQAMATELRQAVLAAEQDSSVGSILLTGAGTAFCSGADLGAANTDPDPARRAAQGQAARDFVVSAINPMMQAFYDCAKPIVAAVNGPAVGGGIGLALVCDIVLASSSARFLPKFTPLLGLIPDLGSTWMLPRLIGPGRAAAVSLLGETISASDAERLGMIWRCHPDEELMAAALQTARQVAKGPGFAMAAAKRALHASFANDFSAQLQLEMELSAECCGHADFCEGAAAFLEKRPPDFRREAADGQ